MKFCPYCNAYILDETIPVCCSCGKDISGEVPVSEDNAGDGYDGYYDDLDPIDVEDLRSELDKALLQNVFTVIGAVVIIISVCVVALLYLS